MQQSNMMFFFINVMSVFLLFSVMTWGQTILNTIEINPDLIYWADYDNMVVGDTQLSKKNCGRDKIYNPLTFLCTSCPSSSGQMVDTSVQDELGNFLQCTCATGYQKSSIDCSTDQSGNCNGIVCTLCPVPHAAFSDGKGCALCLGTSSYSADLNDCACPIGQALIEMDVLGNKANKTCHACPLGSQVISSAVSIAGQSYLPNRYACQTCPDPLMSMDPTLKCACPTTYTMVGVPSYGTQSCVLTTTATPYLTLYGNAQNVKYPEVTGSSSGAAGTTLVSTVMQHFFVKAAAGCAAYAGPATGSNQACEALANLCVLQFYDDQHPVCSTFLAIALARGTTSWTNNVQGWSNALPWLYYANGIDACSDLQFNGRASLRYEYETYVVAVYQLDGTFKGFRPMNTLLTYCGEPAPYSGFGGGTSSSNAFTQFGSGEINHYNCDLATLLAKTQEFYELYIADPRGAGNGLYPMPVRIVNLRNKGSKPNNFQPKGMLCDGGDVLVRRFFLFDIVSGVTASSGAYPQILRYAQNISLTVALKPGSPHKYLPPVLTLQFAEAQAPAANSGAGYAVRSYTVYGSFTMDMTSFNTVLSAFFITAVVLCGLVFILRYLNWNGRNSRSVLQAINTATVGGVNCSVLASMAVTAMHTWNWFFFPFTLAICWFLFMFFKLQATPTIFLPPMINIYSPSSPYYSFTVMIHVLTFFQLTVICALIYRQCNADIFFLDWEPSQNGSKSVWRTILVANEYCEMQTMRKTDIRFTLFWLGLVLIGMNLQYSATQQTTLTDLTPNVQNVILRFGNTTFWWLLFSGIQWALKWGVYQRYISEPPEQIFIDFCTIAKISVLVLDEPYHGYYLHCCSPSHKADCTMAELVHMLHHEEAGMTVDRSLEGAPGDVLSFEVFVTGRWRQEFDKMYQKLVQAPPFSAMMQDAGGANINKAGGGGAGGAAAFGRAMRGRRAGGVHPTEKVLKAWHELSAFLQTFVDNNFDEQALKRTVKEQTYWDKILKTPPPMVSTEQPSVFFPDRRLEYAKMTFLGCERDLLLLNILAYSLFDFWIGSTAISMLLTYLLEVLLCYVRHSYGQSMISRKTLVDERFLF